MGLRIPIAKLLLLTLYNLAVSFPVEDISKYSMNFEDKIWIQNYLAKNNEHIKMEKLSTSNLIGSKIGSPRFQSVYNSNSRSKRFCRWGKRSGWRCARSNYNPYMHLHGHWPIMNILGGALAQSEENARRVAFIEQAFGNSGIQLSVNKDRILVGEGVLTKMCRKTAKPRQFFLFNDILVYGAIVISKKKFTSPHTIKLEGVTVDNIDDSGLLKNGFVIRSPTKSFTVYTSTTDEKTQWMAHIKKCAIECKNKNSIDTSDTLEPSPVWHPDNDALICMVCKKTTFNFIIRKHHCRKCGDVVCGSCSSNKFILASQSPHPQRVCIKCYNLLNSQKAGGVIRPAEGSTDSCNSAHVDEDGDCVHTSDTQPDCTVRPIPENEDTDSSSSDSENEMDSPPDLLVTTSYVAEG